MSRVDDIVAQLTGSQNVIEHVLHADEMKDPAQLRTLLDEVCTHIRPCCGCDFWFELEELNAKDECSSCE